MIRNLPSIATRIALGAGLLFGLAAPMVSQTALAREPAPAQAPAPAPYSAPVQGPLSALLAAHALAGPPVTASLEAAAATTPHVVARPALWKVRQGKVTIYLFGTVHALPKGIDWYGGPLASAFAGSDELVTEILEKSPDEMRQIVTAKAMLPAGQNLRDLLAPADRHGFEAAMTANGLPVATFDHFQPWYAAVALSTLPLLHSGYDPANGVDSLLSERAKLLGHPHEALETPEFQLGLFGALSMATQVRYLHEVVTTLPSINAELAGMVAAWKAGDAERLARIMNADEDDPQLRDLLLLDRNRTWAKWIRQRLAEPGAKPDTLFIAVGAGHLAGPGSVLQQLRSSGIHATRVQ